MSLLQDPLLQLLCRCVKVVACFSCNHEHETHSTTTEIRSVDKWGFSLTLSGSLDSPQSNKEET
jgi:hypothetical protein